MFDIKSLSSEELEALAEAIRKEKREREDIRFAFLAKQAADALNALKAEFPYVRLDFEVECEDCGDIDVNLFDCFHEFSARKFMKA